MAEKKEDSLGTPEVWEKMWQVGDTPWHQDKHDDFLDKHEADMFGGVSKKVFVPLCGKSKDMVWLYEHGHTVVGVEIVERAVQDFFVENKLEVDVQEFDTVGKVYKSKDGKIEVYVTDLFSLSIDLIGYVDLIWDSGSLTAINSDDNTKYVELLSSFLKEGSTWYAYTLHYDPSVWPGPPQSLSDEQVAALFGSRFTIEKVEEETHTSLEAIKRPVETSDASMSDRIEHAINRSSYLNNRRYRFTAAPSQN